MPAAIPPARPRATLAAVTAAALAVWKLKHGSTPLPPLYVLAARGYYRDTMGVPGQNDVGIYDDAIFIVTHAGLTAWNANTDPSRTGWNPGAGKYMARLSPGVWNFRRLKHHAARPDGYLAFGQGSAPVTVQRIRQNGSIATTETGCFGINLHRGGVNGTSSEGCLTIPAGQWPAFDVALAQIVGANPFTLILTDAPLTP